MQTCLVLSDDLAQCYTYMSERGHGYGGLTDYHRFWLLNANRKGDLQVSEAIPCQQEATATRRSVSEVRCTLQMLRQYDCSRPIKEVQSDCIHSVLESTKHRRLFHS